MNKRKILNDPVYGFITIPSEKIFSLIEHPIVQRLRRIKQVGLTHFVYPGALHTRFHHALGAMHLMSEAIRSLRSKAVEISEEEREAALIAILLHDLGHGPYSHALEHVLLNVGHETITLALMQLLNEEFGGSLDLAVDIFAGTYERRFLHQLVSSQLDLDRMDYLKRDSFFTGVAEGVIGHDRIIKMLDVRNDEIVVEQKALYSIEKFLVARRLMYWQVYLHKTVISAEQMLKQLVLLIKQKLSEGYDFDLPADLRTLLEKRTNVDSATLAKDEILNIFARVDDIEIDYTTKSLRNSSVNVINILSKGLVNRRLFKTILLENEVPQETFETIQDGLVSSGLDREEAKDLILTGVERNSAYVDSRNEIKVLMKSGEIRPISEIAEFEVRSTVNNKYFISYPKLLAY